VHGFCTLSAHRLHICPNWGLFCAWLAQRVFRCTKKRILREEHPRQLAALLCVHLPDGFKDLLTGDFCCRRLFVLPGLRCCRGQVLEIEICLDLLCQFQPGLVETLLVHPDAGADAQYPEILRVVAQTETLAKRERAGRCQLS
jgi:site-specific DNA recombinase